MRLRALSFNVNFQSGLEPHCEIVIPDGYLSKSVFNLALVEFSKVSAGRTRKGNKNYLSFIKSSKIFVRIIFCKKIDKDK